MATSTKISQLSTMPSVLALEDLIPIVDDPGGSPSTWRLHLSTLKTAMVSSLQTSSGWISGLTSFAVAGNASSQTISTQTVYSSTYSGFGIIPVGGVIPYAGSTVPAGWLFCYGQAISRATYSLLFSAVSTIYGVGDTSTTFNLPDLRGRVAAGKDDMGGTSANRLTDQSGGLDGDVLGDTGGDETHTLSTAQIPAHTHTAGASVSWAQGDFNPASGRSIASTGLATSSTGGGGAHNNVQPTIILNYIVYAAA